MENMPARLLPRIHPFWLTLAYGMWVGYEVHKHEIDKRIGRLIGAAFDEVSRHQANLMLDEIDKRKLPVSDGMRLISPQTADLNGTKG